MRHEVCPSTMTIENLADWIRTNKVDVVNNIEELPLTEEEINNLQKQSSLASRQLDKLKATLKYFTDLIKNGTPFDTDTEMHRPIAVTIPPSKGTARLEENRKFADRQLENGFKEIVTPIYFIPWPEFEKMVAIDIEGNEWTKYSRGMSRDEISQHGRPVLSAAVDASLRKKKQQKLSEGEREELDSDDLSL
jgi:hypothetical protein